MWYQSHHNWTTSYLDRTWRSCVGIHPYMASCYWSISGASGWLVKGECACDMGTFIGFYYRSYTWSGSDQCMYAKEELTRCNRFSTAHIVTAQSQKHMEYTSNSYPSFIHIPQPVTIGRKIINAFVHLLFINIYDKVLPKINSNIS